MLRLLAQVRAQVAKAWSKYYKLGVTSILIRG